MKIKYRLVHHQVATDIPDTLSKVSEVRSSPTAVALREEHKADLVAHWNVNGVSLAYSLVAETRGFSTSTITGVQYTYTGALHDRITSNATDPNNDNYGHFLEFPNNVSYRTVMAYPECHSAGIAGFYQIIPYFSNPLISYNGVPTGIAAPDSNAADNARFLSENALGTYRLRIFSAVGDVLFTQEGDLTERAITLFVEGYSTGTYLVVLETISPNNRSTLYRGMLGVQ